MPTPPGPSGGGDSAQTFRVTASAGGAPQRGQRIRIGNAWYIVQSSRPSQTSGYYDVTAAPATAPVQGQPTYTSTSTPAPSPTGGGGASPNAGANLIQQIIDAVKTAAGLPAEVAAAKASATPTTPAFTFPTDFGGGALTFDEQRQLQELQNKGNMDSVLAQLRASMESGARSTAESTRSNIVTGLQGSLESAGYSDPSLFLSGLDLPQLQATLAQNLREGNVLPTEARTEAIASAANDPHDILRLLYLAGGQDVPAHRTGEVSAPAMIHQGEVGRDRLARIISSLPLFSFDDLVKRFSYDIPGGERGALVKAQTGALPWGGGGGDRLGELMANMPAMVPSRARTMGMGSLAAGGAHVVEGPSLFVVGDRPKGKGGFDSQEFVLAAPGSVIAPKWLDEPLTEEAAVQAVHEMLQHGKRKPRVAGAATGANLLIGGISQADQAAQVASSRDLMAQRTGGAPPPDLMTKLLTVAGVPAATPPRDASTLLIGGKPQWFNTLAPEQRTPWDRYIAAGNTAGSLSNYLRWTQLNPAPVASVAPTPGYPGGIPPGFRLDENGNLVPLLPPSGQVHAPPEGFKWINGQLVPTTPSGGQVPRIEPAPVGPTPINYAPPVVGPAPPTPVRTNPGNVAPVAGMNDPTAIINYVANQYGYDGAFFVELARRESSLNPHNVFREANGNNSIGLFQLQENAGLLPDFYAKGFTDPYDPWQQMNYVMQYYVANGEMDPWSASDATTAAVGNPFRIAAEGAIVDMARGEDGVFRMDRLITEIRQPRSLRRAQVGAVSTEGQTFLDALIEGLWGVGASLAGPERGTTDRLHDLTLQILPSQFSSFGDRAQVLSLLPPQLWDVMAGPQLAAIMHSLDSEQLQRLKLQRQADIVLQRAQPGDTNAVQQAHDLRAQADQLKRAPWEEFVPGGEPNASPFSEAQQAFLTDFQHRFPNVNATDKQRALQLGLTGLADMIGQLNAGLMTPAQFSTVMQNFLTEYGPGGPHGPVAPVRTSGAQQAWDQLMGALDETLTKGAPGTQLPFAAIEALPAGAQAATRAGLGGLFGSDVVNDAFDLFNKGSKYAFAQGAAQMGLGRGF